MTPVNDPEAERNLSLKEAKQRLGLGTTSLFKEIKNGELKVVKYGRRTFIPLSQVLAWIQRHTVEASA